MKVTLLFITLIASVHVDARKASVKKRTKKERKEILSRIYNKKDSEPRALLHFMHNASRDCEGHAYHKNDLDLQVLNIYKTYPKQLRVKFVKEKADVICLRNILRFHKQDPKELGKSVLLASIKSIGGRYWPYTYTSELNYIAKVLSKDCREEDVLYFDKLLKKFYEQTRKKDGWCKKYHEEFAKNCKQYSLKNCK